MPAGAALTYQVVPPLPHVSEESFQVEGAVHNQLLLRCAPPLLRRLLIRRLVLWAQQRLVEAVYAAIA
jgi:hypothetical protein